MLATYPASAFTSPHVQGAMQEKNKVLASPVPKRVALDSAKHNILEMLGVNTPSKQ